ncbi:MAG: hypothetical protein ACK5KO_04730 [Arachnia sp.]
MSTQIDVVVCGRCGGPLSAGLCSACGHRLDQAVSVPPPSAWRGPWPPAHILAVIGGFAIDLVICAAAGGIVWLLAAWLRLATWVGAVLTAAAGLAAAALMVRLLLVRGRAPGHLITRARWLGQRTGLPAGSPSHRLPMGQLTWVSTAEDPLRRLNAAAPGAAAETVPLSVRTRPILTAADGSSAPIGSRLLVGRYPMRHEPGANALEIYDMTRTLGRRHVTIDADRHGNLHVTDLGSANGTAVTSAAGTAVLEPHHPTPVLVPCTLICGDQVLSVSLAELTPATSAVIPQRLPGTVLGPPEVQP